MLFQQKKGRSMKSINNIRAEFENELFSPKRDKKYWIHIKKEFQGFTKQECINALKFYLSDIVSYFSSVMALYWRMKPKIERIRTYRDQDEKKDVWIYVLSFRFSLCMNNKVFPKNIRTHRDDKPAKVLIYGDLPMPK